MWFKVFTSSWRKSGTTNAEREVKVGDPENVVSSSECTPQDKDAGFGEPRRIVTYREEISFVQFSPDGQHVVIGSKNGTIRQSKVEAGCDVSDVLEAWSHTKEETSTQVVSKDGKWIVLAGGEGRRVAVWDALTHERVTESAEAHEQKITALDVSSDASKIASGSQDGVVFVWCLETGERLASPFQQGHHVLLVRFSAKGDRLACAGWNFSVYIWNFLGDGDRAVTCIPTDPVHSLAWSIDGFLYAGCYRGSILSFDVSGSTAMSKWPGHPHFDSISALRLSNNGKFIVSASSSERIVKVWDVQTQSDLAYLNHSGEVLGVDISPDDGILVTGTKDGKIYFWDIRKVLPAPYLFHSLSASLSPLFRSDAHPILTEISNAAYISWRKGNLIEAEHILSLAIALSTSPPSKDLASRALIRARLKQWDGAFDDAQLSVLIAPLLVSRLALGIAQSGLRQYDAATETFDIALRGCDWQERDFVRVLRAVILFEAGFHDEAIRHAKDVSLGPPDVERPCAFVQAKMYTLLATDAMTGREHAKAIQLLIQARELCSSGQISELELDTISLITGWVFDGLRLATYRQLCEAYHAAERTPEGLDVLREMEDIFRVEIKLRSELRGWLDGFKKRCIERLESQGDLAMQNLDYRYAAAQYSVALDIDPAVMQASLFIGRSKARTALGVWEDALGDADRAIRLDPSSPWGYERRHAALHQLERYEEAIEALKEMISILENSSDPEIRRFRGNYVDPSGAREAILEVFWNFVDISPFRLIDTMTGRLCDAEKRMRIFKKGSVFQEMVSSTTTQLDRDHIKTVTGRFFQYVMLSHRWEAKELELADVQGKSIYDLEASPSSTKLQRFCRLARDSGFRWAWSDTCCIDKNKDVEFEKSINSMFRWYSCSAATFVYLTGVPRLLIPGALKGSVWMTRGWTLQELLAPRVIRFYHDDWTPYLDNASLNHKESPHIMRELEDATGVTAHDLCAFRPGPEDIAVKLRLASTRETTVPVDMAYGLFGIFGLTMPVIHGESQQHALGRLFQEIVARSGDVTCLAWVGKSSEFNSTFPDCLRVYEHPSRTISHVGKEDMESRVVELQRAWSREEEEQAVRFYERLCELPLARCINQHLFLPCVVFHVTALKKVVKRVDGIRVYRATTRVLEDTEICSQEKFLPTRDQSPQDLVLVCPWIPELLDTTPMRHDELRRCRPTVEAMSSPHSRSDSDSESEPETEIAFARETAPRATSTLLLDADHSLSSPAGSSTDITLKASTLLVRFRQPFCALLLLGLGRGLYRRVGTDREIIACVRNGVSLDDMTLQTLEVR